MANHQNSLSSKFGRASNHIDATIDGRKLKADYSGRPYGHCMKGKIKYDLDGNEGEMDFAAKRQSAKK